MSDRLATLQPMLTKESPTDDTKTGPRFNFSRSRRSDRFRGVTVENRDCQCSPITGEHLLLRIAVAGIHVHNEDAMNRLVMEPINASRKMSIVAYRQLWITWYSATTRTSWTRRSLYIAFRMLSSTIWIHHRCGRTSQVGTTDACDQTGKDGR